LLKAKFFYKEVEKRLKKNGDITILIAYDFFLNFIYYSIDLKE
jgi:hypothetical protein